MKIIYPNNNATLVPLRITGKAIEITQWLRGEQYVPYLKSVFAFNVEDKYDDGQGNEYDFIQDPETGEYQ